MILKIELSTGDVEALVRSEIARRFPSLRIEELYVPYFGTDLLIVLNDEPEPPSVEPAPVVPNRPATEGDVEF